MKKPGERDRTKEELTLFATQSTEVTKLHIRVFSEGSVRSVAEIGLLVEAMSLSVIPWLKKPFTSLVVAVFVVGFVFI